MIKDFITEEELELDDDLYNDAKVEALVEEDQICGGMQGFMMGYMDAF
jgi:hypothetical protein